MTDETVRLSDRRRLLLGLAATGSLAGGLAPAQAAAPHANVATGAAQHARPPNRQPFYGRHQAGIVTPRPAAGLVGVVRGDRRECRSSSQRLFRTLTERAAFLTQGGTPPALDPRFPPADSGILGPVVTPDNLTMTVSVGASLFDERYGLAERKPDPPQPHDELSQ